jgi:hypothetical protein
MSSGRSMRLARRMRRSASASPRLTTLAEALAAFYERSEPWWRVYEREPQLIAAWGGGV